MNRTFAAVLACLLTAQMLSAANVIDNYIKHRFNAETVQVKDVQGLSQRISYGKLHLRLKDFLELVLKNSTDVQLTRLDVYTAAYQIMAAKAPFDPTSGSRRYAQAGVGIQFPSYGFGVQFTFPFRNSTAQANLADSLVSKARDEYQKRQTEQQIILDVRQAH